MAINRMNRMKNRALSVTETLMLYEALDLFIHKYAGADGRRADVLMARQVLEALQAAETITLKHPNVQV